MRLSGILVLLTSVALTACQGSKPKFIDAAVPIDGGDDASVIVIDAGVDAPPGQTTTSTVTGAVRATSPGYKLYGTVESGDRSGSSPSYRSQGRVTGATEDP